MKIVAVLNLPKPAKQVTAIARMIVGRMTDNPLFPSPWPPLAKLAAEIDALAAADARVLTRARGTRAARDARHAALRSDLQRLAGYVQEVADASSPASAEAIIASAGMDVKQFAIPTKAPLKALQGDVSGSVKLLAKWADDRARYDWRYGIDRATWTLAPSTLQARTVIRGLTPVTTYFFQVRVTTIDGPRDWSQVISLVVR